MASAAELGVRPPGGVFDGVDRRAGQKEHAGDLPTTFGIHQVENDIALVQTAGPDDHRRLDPGQLAGQDAFGSLPFRSVRPEEGGSRENRGCLAKVDAVQAGPTDRSPRADAAAGLYANARIVAVNGRRVRRCLVASRTIRTVPPQKVSLNITPVAPASSTA